MRKFSSETNIQIIFQCEEICTTTILFPNFLTLSSYNREPWQKAISVAYSSIKYGRVFEAGINGRRNSARRCLGAGCRQTDGWSPHVWRSIHVRSIEMEDSSQSMATSTVREEITTMGSHRNISRIGAKLRRCRMRILARIFYAHQQHFENQFFFKRRHILFILLRCGIVVKA